LNFTRIKYKPKGRDFLSKFVICVINGGIAEITIDHPPVNALSAAVLAELGEVVGGLLRENCGAVIVTGAGEKAFVAGADISRFPGLDPAGGEELAREGQKVFANLAALPVPVIAAINGFALGGGLELALACDIRIAAENAQLGQPEVNLGIIPGYGGTQRLARLIGPGKAKELIFTADSLSAKDAWQVGLVEQVVGRGEALEAARKLAEKILSKGPLAIKKAKAAIDQGLEVSLAEGLSLEARYFGELCGTLDQKEGAKAFLEKRKAVFTGK